MTVHEGLTTTARDPVGRHALWVSWPLLLGIAGFIAVTGCQLGLADPDIYLHVAVGRWMVMHLSVPTQDPFSFTMHGAPWVAQEWGAELLSFALFRLAGWSGLVLFGAACFGATLAYLSRFLLRRMEPLHALLLSGLAAAMMLPYAIDRPHAFVWPLTVVWVAGMVRASEEKRAPAWWLLGVMLLWLNMHASFILGLVLMLLLAFDSVECGNGDRLRIGRRWLPFCGAAFVLVLFNPQGYRLLLFPFHVLGIREMLGHFKDWRPPNLHHLQVLDIWLIVVIGAAFAGRVKLSLSRACALFGLLYMALQSKRNIALLGLLSPLVLAAPVACCWKQAARSARDAKRIDRLFRTLSRPAPLLISTALIVVVGVAGAASLWRNDPGPPAIYAPNAGLQVILSRVAQPRILNDVNFGDYLVYRGVPVFIDARADMYGQRFLQTTFSAMALAPGGNIESLLAKYRINAILLWPGEPVVKLLNRLPDWQRVYQDGLSVAYVRRAFSVS